MRLTLLALLLCSGATAAQAVDLSSILAPIAPRVAPPNGVAGQSPRAASGVPQNVQILNEPEVLAALQQEIASQLNVDGELRLAFARPWTPIRVPSSAWKLSLVQTPASGLSANMLLNFRIEAEGRAIGEWQQVTRAQVWKPVFVASRRIDRGQPLDSSLCATQTIDVLRERQALVPADTDLSRYEMAQTVSQERPLAWRDVALKPLVRKGQTVEVIASEGSINISLKGIAVTSGGAGEAVTVRNPDTRKDFSARVTGANTVQVAF